MLKRGVHHFTILTNFTTILVEVVVWYCKNEFLRILKNLYDNIGLLKLGEKLYRTSKIDILAP